jgi:hypothetical protein
VLNPRGLEQALELRGEPFAEYVHLVLDVKALELLLCHPFP